MRASGRRTAFLGAIVGAITSGAETYDWTCAEFRKMEAMICRFLRVRLMEDACDGTSRKCWTNKEVLKYRRVAPMRVEIAVRRTAWLQVVSHAPQEHAQVTTAVSGTMLDDSPMDSVGHLRPDARHYARMFQRDLELFKGISLAGRLLLRQGDWRAKCEAGDTAVEFSLIDPRLLRVAFWSLFLPTVVAQLKRASADFGRSFVCELTKRDRNLCGEQFLSKKGLRAHQVWFSSVGGGHGLVAAPLAVCRSNECLWCRSLFSSARATRQHMRDANEMEHCRVDGGDSQMSSCDER